ncbi:transcription elongation factor GreA [Alphaproteobacteria bacterium]|nr:transcription elongation factor GreA [Alphaproteobacteria bacterium]
MEKIPMTLTGYKKLHGELRELKGTERPRIIDAIAAARSLGDLSENAEYHAAKEKQRMIEDRIFELEKKIGMADIIDQSKIQTNRIAFGATVELLDETTMHPTTFQIVGSDEADIKNGLLPVTSPLAKALIGKTLGDPVEVTTPNGTKYYEIKNVKYA